MVIKNKIVWKKPDYKNHFNKVSNKEIDEMCIEGSQKIGDIIIEKDKYGRKITFTVYRVEKIGEQIEGIDTLTRERAIEELKKILKEKKKSK